MDTSTTEKPASPLKRERKPILPERAPKVWVIIYDKYGDTLCAEKRDSIADANKYLNSNMDTSEDEEDMVIVIRGDEQLKVERGWRISEQ